MLLGIGIELGIGIGIGIAIGIGIGIGIDIDYALIPVFTRLLLNTNRSRNGYKRLKRTPKCNFGQLTWVCRIGMVRP